MGRLDILFTTTNGKRHAVYHKRIGERVRLTDEVSHHEEAVRDYYELQAKTKRALSYMPEEVVSNIVDTMFEKISVATSIGSVPSISSENLFKEVEKQLTEYLLAKSEEVLVNVDGRYDNAPAVFISTEIRFTPYELFYNNLIEPEGHGGVEYVELSSDDFVVAEYVKERLQKELDGLESMSYLTVVTVEEPEKPFEIIPKKRNCVELTREEGGGWNTLETQQVTKNMQHIKLKSHAPSIMPFSNPTLEREPVKANRHVVLLPYVVTDVFYEGKEGTVNHTSVGIITYSQDGTEIQGLK